MSVDFVAAFHRGQQAALQAREDREEIDDIVQALSDDLFGVTDGKLRISIRKFPKRFPVLPDGAVSAGDDEWLCACNEKIRDAGEVRVAKWMRPYRGFPCTLIFGGREVRCHDGDALGEALAELLQDAWVADQLKDLLGRSGKLKLMQ
jgi:hypothetical protein